MNFKNSIDQHDGHFTRTQEKDALKITRAGFFSRIPQRCPLLSVLWYTLGSGWPWRWGEVLHLFWGAGALLAYCNAAGPDCCNTPRKNSSINRPSQFNMAAHWSTHARHTAPQFACARQNPRTRNSNPKNKTRPPRHPSVPRNVKLLTPVNHWHATCAEPPASNCNFVSLFILNLLNEKG